MQNHLNLLYREEEREMLPLCRAEGIGVIPWSPLARGRLARDGARSRRRSAPGRMRSATRSTARRGCRPRVLDRVGEIVAARGLPRAQVALAWLLQKPGVTAPIVGATKPEHLKDAVAAVGVKLSSRRDRGAGEGLCAARGGGVFLIATRRLLS